MTPSLQFQLCHGVMRHHQLRHWEQDATYASSMLLFGHKAMLAVMVLLLQLSPSWHASMHSTEAALRLFMA
jgi:hypothetical protein